MKSARGVFETQGILSVGAALSISMWSAQGLAVPPEYFHSIALHPTDPNTFVARYEGAFGGLFMSRDGGKTVQIVPGQAFYTYGLRRWIPMLIAGDGKLLIALDTGLDVDNGAGCLPAPPEGEAHYSEPAVKGLWVTDVTSHPSDPKVSFVLTTGDTKGAHAGVWRRDAQGVITALGTSQPLAAGGKLQFMAGDLHVVARSASIDGVRLIVAGSAFDHSVMPMTSTSVLRISDDLGATWTSTPIPDTTGGNPRILIADGSEPLRAIVAIENGFGEESSDPVDPVFVTKDGGKSFTPYLDKLQVIGDSVLLPSGEILLADRGSPGGLWSAPNFDTPPTKVRESNVNCLAYQASTQKLVMCAGYEIGYFDLASKQFCAMVRMNEATGFPSCPSAPLDQNKKAIDQLCGGFCGAAHYASAPVCTAFKAPANVTCGVSAVAYDNMSPDPDKRWLEPPGMNAAPRCAGFTGRPDGGVAPVADAGTSGGGDAGITGGGDAGVPADAAVSAPPDASGGVIPGADAAVNPTTPGKKGGSGCQAARDPANAPQRGGFMYVAALALLATLYRRRGARGERRSR